MRAASILASGAALAATALLTAPSAQAAPALDAGPAVAFSCGTGGTATWRADETVLVRSVASEGGTSWGQVNQGSTRTGCAAYVIGNSYSSCGTLSNRWVAVNWNGQKGYSKQACMTRL
ncbi:hypothetical protein ACWDR0_14030 [Streptomyces sp. NPDC003691]